MSDNRAVATAAETNGELRNRVRSIRLDSQLGKGTGRSGGSWLPWILCGLLALSWAAVGIRGYRNGTFKSGTANEAGPEEAANAAKANGKDAPADAPAGTIQLEVKGYIIPARQIAVSPIDVAGRLIDLNVVEGRYYKEGELLAQIDPTSFKATADESASTLQAAEKRLEATKQRLAEVSKESVREIEIRQVDATINEAKAQEARAADEEKRISSTSGASGRELVQARNDLLAAQARTEKLKIDRELLIAGPRKEKVAAAVADMAAAQADVEGAKARLSQAKWRLDNCTIRAPLSGTVLSKSAEKGNLVNPLAFAATSGSICNMADLSDLEVDLEIPERDISKLKVGQACRVRCDAYPKKVYDARLDRIMPIANRAKSIVNVRVKITLPADERGEQALLKPEMGAVVSFLAAEK